MENEKLKIIFAGSVGSGKTTAIESISDVTTFSTEEKATDEVKLMKENTTVAMDYGAMLLDNGAYVHLYGTPGQKRFSFMWEILAEGAIGIIIVINCAVENALDELGEYLLAFKSAIENASLIIGVTHTDLWTGIPIETIKYHVRKFNPSIPVFSFDARDKNETSSLLKSLLYHIDPEIL